MEIFKECSEEVGNPETCISSMLGAAFDLTTLDNVSKSCLTIWSGKIRDVSPKLRRHYQKCEINKWGRIGSSNVTERKGDEKK